MMNDSHSLIKVSNLRVGYDGKEVLNCPSLEVNPGDFIGVIGPNGGGKTTLIKALLKSIPFQGAVEYDGKIEQNGTRRIGYLPQIHQIDRSFPIEVREAVLSGLQAQKGLFKRYTDDDKAKVEKLLDMTSIKHLSTKSINDLSGGEFQRVMLCRALISEPVLLILDEPNTYVDNRFEGELYHLLAELNKTITIIMVSHDLGTISQYIKSVVCVNHSVHYHPSNQITPEQLQSYNCPIQLVYHDEIPHTVLCKHTLPEKK